uniref:Nudix hydrolase domain-containing protein n=1 Tax=Chromera velia CCMP2878 TaxID=1169474 RepID=A0A0G4FGJ7_9ALVE|eukprot:Cvel_16914.t1-p1 / transcript=Cvel_16914.t1 / gene=Cvel_16914 / organism=Chromera_velia_CCMP2878 / gene_product=ADP-sugar pyrophosphatase, putative / transcript_product=ADP-sugar pyrophosphatase, putative / location=Cvel_scaffold1325:1132-4788(-) / protein_length=211 / sequence_SO=supercontig / SO=protein_coding / is_pseudo=false
MFGEVTKVEDVHTLKWLKLCRIFFKDQTGKERQWEGVQRTTAKKTESNPDSLDAVAIVAFLTHSKEKKPPEMVFVRQFRPPVGTDTIELPAGLIDEGETPEQAAIRELREETGFIGEVVGKSPNLCLCPGITGETIKIITVNVDMDKEENKSPKQQLDEEEQIQVIRIPCDSMLEKLEELSREGCRLFDGVYCFAFALTPTVQSFFKEGSA